MLEGAEVLAVILEFDRRSSSKRSVQLLCVFQDVKQMQIMCAVCVFLFVFGVFAWVSRLTTGSLMTFISHLTTI